MEEESSGRGGMFSNPASAEVGADGEWETDTEHLSPAPSFSPAPLKVGRPEISERQRPVKAEAAAPEVITVEMTPEEQEVYALMGISPLVRLNRQVKNPKSAIVNVKLPGQGNDTQSDVAPRGRNEEETAEVPSAASYGFEPSDFDGEPDFQGDSLTNVSIPDSDELTADVVGTAAAPTESDSGDSLIRRRRRRRSSAVDVDGER